MEVYRVEILMHIFLTSGLEGDEWLASRSHLLNTRGRTLLHPEHGVVWAQVPVRANWFKIIFSPGPGVETAHSRLSLHTSFYRLSYSTYQISIC